LVHLLNRQNNKSFIFFIKLKTSVFQDKFLFDEG